MLDASSLIDYVVRRRGDSLLPDLLRSDAELHVPDLCDVEFAAFLRHSGAPGVPDSQSIDAYLNVYLALPLRRHGHAELLARIHSLRHNISTFDAAYVALAERLEAQLLTADLALARAIRASRAIAVELV